MSAINNNIIKDNNENLHVNINFAGGFYDKDTNLIRFGKRDYSPEQRRWSASDPIDFEGGDLNLYGYVLSDPIQFVDPEGLSAEDNQFIPPTPSKTYCVIKALEETTKKNFCNKFIYDLAFEDQVKLRQICKANSIQDCSMACFCTNFYENLKKYCKLKMPKPKVKK